MDKFLQRLGFPPSGLFGFNDNGSCIVLNLFVCCTGIIDIEFIAADISTKQNG